MDTAVAPPPQIVPDYARRRPPVPPSAARRAAHRLAGWAVLGLVAVAVAVAGLWVRQWAWVQTEPIRFTPDLNNAFRQGTRTGAVGYLDRYDDERLEPQHAWVMGLDYGPGRLAVTALWARWVRAHVTAPAVGPDRLTAQWFQEFYTRARQLDATYDLCRPLLMVNLTGEALAAVAMFLLVRRCSSDAGRRPVRGAVTALVATSLFWLDPALIWNAHCWPQWDSWVLPFLLWATLAATADLWFTAGAIVAAGAMFKGQVLFSSVLFLAWPLMAGKPGAAARWVIGVAAGGAALTAVWSVRTAGALHRGTYVPGHADPAAVAWVVDAAVAFAVVAVAFRGRPWVRRATGAGWADRDPGPRHIAAGVTAAVAALGAAAAAAVGAVAVAGFSGHVAVVMGCVAVVAVGWAAAITVGSPAVPTAAWVGARVLAVVAAAILVSVPVRHAVPLWAVALAATAMAGAVWLLPARRLGVAAAGWVAAAVFLCVPVFGGSGQWFAVGVAHGTTARNMMSAGTNNNLANLLEDVWGWHLDDPTISLPPGSAADAVNDFLHYIDPHVPRQRGQAVALPLKYLLLVVWVAGVLASAAGAARHGRSRGPRFLLAVAAPWVALFAVLGQMHQRYLLWGAALTSMAVAVSPGLVAVHLLLSVVSAGQEMQSMIGDGRHPSADQAAWAAEHPAVVSVVRGYTPGMGWAVVLVAAIFVYLAAAGRRGASTPGGEIRVD